MRTPAMTIVCLGVAATTHAQCPEQRLWPIPQPGSGDFGWDVAMNADHLIVGDRHSDAWCGGDPTCSSGAVYAYRRGHDGRWQFSELVFPADAGRRFALGTSVALDGDRMVVGASLSDLAGTDIGAAYVFEFDGEQWVETNQITPLPPIDSDEHGSIVGIFDRTILMGNYYQIRVYKDDGEDWVLTDTLRSPLSGRSGISFGYGNAMDETWLILGDAFDRTYGSEAGAVHVYRWDDDGRPQYDQTLLTPDPETGRRFGIDVELVGDELVVGAMNATQFGSVVGAAFVYRLVDDQWTLVQRIDPPDLDDIHFGVGLELGGNTLAIGAGNDRTGGIWGSVRIYRRGPDDLWAWHSTITPAEHGASFGAASAMHAGELAVGARQTHRGGVDQGSVDVFDLDCLLCAPDLDADGTLTIFDFLTFLNLFQDGDAQADFDGDGELTIFDFLAFQTAFDAGCA